MPCEPSTAQRSPHVQSVAARVNKEIPDALSRAPPGRAIQALRPHALPMGEPPAYERLRSLRVATPAHRLSKNLEISFIIDIAA